MNNSKYVVATMGRAPSDLSREDSLSKKWFFLKPMIGNTAPSVGLPFAWLTASPYSGCYPCGSGMYGRSFTAYPKKVVEKNSLIGFTALHHSGTGYIRKFYNFMLTTFDNPTLSMLPIEREEVSPGYYRADFAGKSVEVTTDKGNIYYRTSNASEVTFCPKHRGIAEGNEPTATAVKLEIKDGGLYISAEFVDISIHIYLKCDEVAKSEGHIKIADDIAKIQLATGEFRVGYSLISAEKAKENYHKGTDFETAKGQAKAEWDRHLDVIEVEGDEEKKRTFYTCLYHSLKKPVDISDENFLIGGRQNGVSAPSVAPTSSATAGPMYADFATLWDMYKTHAPLIALLYPQKYRDMVTALLAYTKQNDYDSPCALLLDKTRQSNFNDQASCLLHYMVMTAFCYGIKLDYAEAVDIMAKNIMLPRYAPYTSGGFLARNTHNIDISDACFFTSKLYEHLGNEEKATFFRKLSENWTTAYDAKCRYLKRRGKYYEGSRVTYSFRLFMNAEKRIEKLSARKFERLLDKFFGLNKCAKNAPRFFRQANSGLVTTLFGFYNRFQGLNNEPDMEAMYNYHLIGKPEKAQKIVASAINNFSACDGGLPGNDDSGGLSSWYVLNAMGIFPRVGTKMWFFGSPIFTNIKINGTPLSELLARL